MKKNEAKEIAKKILLESIGIAYYKISDSNDYWPEDSELIIEYINKLGEKMAKSINGKYITY